MDSRIYINNDWLFTPKFDESMISGKLSAARIKKDFSVVRIPHSFVETPLNYFDEKNYQMVAGYRKEFVTDKAWKNKRVFVTFEGAAHKAKVYLNGELLGVHSSGYTAFKFELTELLAPEGKNNILVVELDSRESVDAPPFGFVIDYLTYSGLYRDVYLEVKNDIYIEDVFVKTQANHIDAEVTFGNALSEDCDLHFRVLKWEKDVPEKKLEVVMEADSHVTAGEEKTESVTSSFVAGKVSFWSPENPALYLLETSLISGDKKVQDVSTVRFGFRTVEMKDEGLFINGNKVLLRGLDRHQAYPYVGYAVPKSLQEMDAEILKNELCLNAVRTSHYPQSQYFIDRCDELGLLVFTEIPGWQHIGQSEGWREQCVRNVQEMVLQYRNHPSIFLWGVRINESPDDDELYVKTNACCHELDSTRPTGGVRCIKKSHLLEDVYTYNDFVHDGTNMGTEKKENIMSEPHAPYLVSEYCGHMYPTKIFDDEIHRTEHALRHARVINSAAGQNNTGGSFGWCAFDYNTHGQFGSGDKICYHGVMDMFRNPKMASLVYASQQDNVPVLDVSSSMDVGEHPACMRGYNWIFTNADSVKMYVNDKFITEYKKEDSQFENLPHGPILINDYVGDRLEKEEGYSKGLSKQMRKILNYVAMNGQNAFTLKEYLTIAALQLKGKNPGEIRRMYDKYVGAWGGDSIVFKFEAIKDGKPVKTVYKGPVEAVFLNAAASKLVLHEENSWDAAAVRICMKDQFGNVLPYYSEAVSLKVTGPVELIGPEVTCFRGGVCGTYVKTTGKKGKATLVIQCGKYESRLEFIVK